MPLFGQQLVFALIEARYFARAHAIIEGFDRWASFDDFICERDGLYIGLCSAGEDARLVAVSIAAFEQWAIHSGAAATLRSLDEFAACIDAFRRTRSLPTEGSLAENAKDEVRGLAVREVRPAIDAFLYREWLETLARLELKFPPPSVDDYARFLMESWSDLS